MEGARSALERSASDQLKPSPTRRDGLDFSSTGDGLLAEDRDWAWAWAWAWAGVVVEVVLAPKGGERRTPASDEGAPAEGPEPERGGYLPLLMLPARASRSACAPKETLRAQGELGVAPGEELSGSSATASSVGAEPRELDMLPRRKDWFPKAEVWVGEPDRPRVVMDRRRWFACWLGCLPELL